MYKRKENGTFDQEMPEKKDQTTRLTKTEKQIIINLRKYGSALISRVRECEETYKKELNNEEKALFLENIIQASRDLADLVD